MIARVPPEVLMVRTPDGGYRRMDLFEAASVVASYFPATYEAAAQIADFLVAEYAADIRAAAREFGWRGRIGRRKIRIAAYLSAMECLALDMDSTKAKAHLAVYVDRKV